MKETDVLKIIRSFFKAIKTQDDLTPKPFDRRGTVTRIDRKTGEAYVLLEGTDEPTPVRMSIHAEVGDAVQVREADHKAWLTGNYTEPPTGDKAAVEAKQEAAEAKKNTDIIIEEIESGELKGEPGEGGTRTYHSYAAPTQGIGWTFQIAGLHTAQGMPRKGDFIMYSFYRYAIISVGATTVQCNSRTDLRGASLTGIVEEYALSATADQPDDADFDDNVKTPTATYPYLWNRERLQFSDGSENVMAAHILLTYTPGIAGKGIASVTNYYKLSTTTTPPGDTPAWSTTPPTMTATNKYLWNYEVIQYTDGSTPTTTSKVIIGVYGDKGDTGASGAGISTVMNYYLATSAGSGVTRDTAGWTTTVQTMTSTNQYLWNYEKCYDSNSTLVSTTDPVIIGRYGQNGSAGKGISSLVEYYLASASSTGVTRSTAGWTTTVQSPTSSLRFLWNYEKINYTSGDPTYTDPRIIGVYGQKGNDGTNGTDGVGVSTIQQYYYLSTSSSEATGGSWSTTPQTFVHGKYYWTKERLYYDDGSDAYNTAVYNRALTQANEEAYDAKIKAEGVNQYFWTKSTGGTTAVPTGSYVTEIPREDFESSPAGGNLLLQSSAVKLRLASTILAELVADKVTLASGKATVKYVEGTPPIGTQSSHRVVVCKSSDDGGGVRNDATLSSKDISDFNINSTPMAFVNASHYKNNNSKASEVGLWAFDGNGHSSVIYMGIGDAILGEQIVLESPGGIGLNGISSGTEIEKSCTVNGNLTAKNLACGSTSVTPSAANTPTKKSITFGKTFTSPPIVTATALSTVPGTRVTGVGVDNITTTGCDIYVTRTNTTATTIEWIAMLQ